MSENLTTQNLISCHGRTVIYSPYEQVTRDNIITILTNALPYFMQNQRQMIYLDEYRKGKTPILLREKKIRPEINNKINVNRASEIVAFKVGYLLNEPVQYVARGTDEEKTTDKILTLNDYMYISDKEYFDRELAEEFSVCGTSYRFCLPTSRNDVSPFKIYDLKPMEAFVVYSSNVSKKPLMGVIETEILRDEEYIIAYSCYTEDMFYQIENNGDYIIVREEKHSLGMIPIIEYPNNSSRIGDFELVLPLLDAINIVYSNRIDGVEQFIQGLLKFINVDISMEDFEKLKELGAIKIKSNGENRSDVEFLTQQLNQKDVQVLIDSLYQDILTICGMPNQIGSTSSTSDNVGSVIVRNGWEGAESRAKSTELIFKRSEKQFLKLVFNIVSVLKGIDLDLKNVDIKLPRRNYENIMQKSTVLTQMLGSDKIHPKLAFESCGLFTDPEVAYIMSKNYVETLNKISEQLNKKDI